MAKQTVIDVGRESIVAAVCSQRGNGFSIEKISYQKFGGDSPHASCAAALKAAVEDVGAKGAAVVLASRELVEVRTISIPQMDAAELPDVIRFQAQRQFANMGDAWPIDFVLLPAHASGEMVTALVGVISLQEMQSIEKACDAAGVQASHIGMRPLEIARFGIASGQLPQSGSSLLISVSEQMADLMLLNEGRVVQIRGMKLPTDPEQTPSVVKGELRRSLMAASKHLPTGQFNSVMLLADQQNAAILEPIIVDATGASVATTDPTALLASGLTIDDLPASGPRLAAVAGAVALPTADKTTVLDFKNPKKRPPKKSNRNTIVLAATAATLLALGGISWWYWTNADLDQQLEALKTKKIEMEEQQKVASRRSSEFGEIEKFLSASPNWLDELTYISSKIPPSDKVQISGAQFMTTATGQSIVRINSVVADSAESLDEFEASLRDEQHDVNSTTRQALAEAIGKYTWAASPTIVQLKDRGWDLGAQIEAEMMSARRDAREKPSGDSKDADQGEPEEENGEPEEDNTEPTEPPAAQEEPAGDQPGKQDPQPGEQPTERDAAKVESDANAADEAGKEGDTEEGDTEEKADEEPSIPEAPSQEKPANPKVAQNQ